jgi:hypothetical protein
MSDKSDSTPSRMLGQGKIPASGNSDTTAELVSLGCAILRVVLLWITSEAAHRIGRRIELLATATMIPESGTGNARACAALMDMTEDSFKQFAKRRNMPVAKPGDELLYTFGDIPKTFEPPEIPPETTHGRCAKKIPRVSRGEKQGKK